MTKTVLLADDSATMQRVVELTFADQDVRIVSVADGRQAIAAISQSPPDLILADIAMPGCTGYEVAAFVRSQPATARVPVVLLAGAFEAVDRDRARQAGADGVLTKPFDPALLVARVTELLGIAQPSEPVVAPPLEGAVAAAAVAPSAPAPAKAPDRDRYFEEIDEAFAALSRTPRPLLVTPPVDADADADDAAADPDAAAARHGGDPDAARDAAGEPLPAGGPLTDAFAALLDAEQHGIPFETALAPQLAGRLGAADLERLADRVARRVLEQLSDRAVRDTVADIVSGTAERLVRDEIERIRRHIK